MANSIETLLEEVIKLPENERIHFVESVLLTLEDSRKKIETFWANEAEIRQSEWLMDSSKSIPLEEALAELKK
jgi:hypothetical protein